MSRIADSRAAVRAGERLLAVKGSIRGAWEGLGLGWTFDQLMDYLKGGGYGSIPEDYHGQVLGIAASVAVVAVEQERDRQMPEPQESGTFVVEKRESGVVGPFGGDRLWGSLNGQRYCVLLSRDVFPDGDPRWHISVSNEAHLQRGHDVPVWRDFVAIVHQMRPGVPFVLGIPPSNMWMNKNPNVLHALEVKDEALIREWRRHADAVRGTDAATPS
jgi:hypothetical protein